MPEGLQWNSGRKGDEQVHIRPESHLPRRYQNRGRIHQCMAADDFCLGNDLEHLCNGVPITFRCLSVQMRQKIRMDPQCEERMHLQNLKHG